MSRNIICGVVTAAAIAVAIASVIEVWHMHYAYATTSARAHAYMEERALEIRLNEAQKRLGEYREEIRVLHEENESLRQLDHTERLKKIAQLCDLNQPLEPSSRIWNRDGDPITE